MVRVKYRYVVVKVEPQTAIAGSISFSDSALYSSITKSVLKYYGDLGAASIRFGLKCKYCNDRTRIAIVRVKHRIHRFVTSILPLTSVLGEHIVKYRILYNGATIMQCNKFIVEYQKKYLDQQVGTIASANQRNKLVQNVMEISTVTR
ncbi:uncharacterized protein LOC129576661 [Sitodiplosis mosellana]|uniref:uncharacterized protein LOC129576661 n=1 Tax=Sitodiplosis mosellana TaxID=263140 RepID=UPI0024451EA3|nr:uncharacterized protein LOC129576661 [Sitodiplosis mosellana]